MEPFEKMMSLVIKPDGNSPIYNCMLSIKAERAQLRFFHAVGTTGESGNVVSPEYRFRIGSITKLFTATVILQLIEEGLLRLEDSYFDLINKHIRQRLSKLHFFEET